MKLHSTVFSCAFRKRLRSEYRAFPALRRAARRQRRRRRAPDMIPPFFWRLSFLVFPIVVLMHAKVSGHPPLAGVAVVSTWFLAVMLLGAAQVRSQVVGLPPALVNLPFASGDFARLSRCRVVGLLWRPCVDALVLFGVLVGLKPHSLAVWISVPPLAVLCGAAVWSASVWLARFPLPPLVASGVNLVSFGVLVGIGVPIARGWLFSFLVHSAVPLTLLSPGGWLAAALLGGNGSISAGWLLGCAPALVLAATGPRALRELLEQMNPERELLALWNGTPGGEGPLENGEFESSPDPRPVSVSDFSAAWLEPGEGRAEAGWLERWFGEWLGVRERLVLACIATELPPWTRMTRRCALFLAVGVAVAWLRFWVAPSLAQGLAWVEGFALGIGLLIGLPLASGFDQMTGQANIYGQRVARVALYPLRLSECVGLTLKAALIRSVPLGPIVVAAACALAGPWGMSVGELAAGGAKLVFLSVALSPGLCVFAFSGVSNDTRARRWWTGCLVVLLFLGCVLALLALAAATLFAPRIWSGASAFGFAALAWGLSWSYVRLYERGGFDLVGNA